MEARSRLSQNGIPSIVVYLDRSDLVNSSGDIVDVFLSALNTSEYRLAMSVSTFHRVQWKQETVSPGITWETREESMSGDELLKLKQDPKAQDIRVIADDGMSLRFFAADKDIQKTIQEQGMPQQGQETPQGDVSPPYTAPTPQPESKSNLGSFMRPTE